MSGEEQKLRDLSKWRKPKRYQAKLLGEAAGRIFEKEISPKHARYEKISHIWEELLPRELAKHCWIDNFVGGQLQVKVETPAHLYELKMCSESLLEELNRNIGGARIRKIKLALDVQ